MSSLDDHVVQDLKCIISILSPHSDLILWSRERSLVAVEHLSGGGLGAEGEDGPHGVVQAQRQRGHPEGQVRQVGHEAGYRGEHVPLRPVGSQLQGMSKMRADEILRALDI